jgi:ribosomal protein S1
VTKVDGAAVEVRLADGRTGVIDRRDFTSAPAIGSTVPAAVLARDDDRRGRVAMSHRWARTELAWQRVEKAKADRTPLTGRVVKEVKGGLVVDVGLRAFLPTSLIGDVEIAEEPAPTSEGASDAAPADAGPDEAPPARPAPGEGAAEETAARTEVAPTEATPPEAVAEAASEEAAAEEPTPTGAGAASEGRRPQPPSAAPAPVKVRVADPAALVGREIEVLVTEADRAKDRLVVSRRDLQRRQRRKEEKERWGALRVGARMRGRVVSVADYGAVVDLGGIRGLVHRSELSWQRFSDPSEVVSVGDRVSVEVLDVNRSKKRVSLSLRRTMPDPYAGVEVGQIVPATITRVVEYGAFARLDSGAEGLIHMSELSDVPGYRPDQLVVPGEEVTVKVLNVDTAKHRIGLSVRRVLVDD